MDHISTINHYVFDLVLGYDQKTIKQVLSRIVSHEKYKGQR